MLLELEVVLLSLSCLSKDQEASFLATSQRLSRELIQLCGAMTVNHIRKLLLD